MVHSLSVPGLEESGWIYPAQTSRQLPREQENNAPGITQGFLHFAHPARVEGGWDDLLPVKDDFWWVTPEFEIPALLWWDTHSHKAGVGQTPAFWPGLHWCGSGMRSGAAESKLGSHFLFYVLWCPTQYLTLRVCLGDLCCISSQVPHHL